MEDAKIIFLDLPKVCDAVESALTELCNNIEISSNRYNRIQSYYTNTQFLPMAAQEYGTEMVPDLPVDIIEYVRTTYGAYFDGGVFATIARASNILGIPSVTPPHCDRHRQVAINYLLQTGGSSVTTTLYTETRKSNDLSTGENLDYNKVTAHSKTVLPLKKWHAFNAQRYHSVEDIEGDRFYFSLILHHNPSFGDFVNQHSNLIPAT